MSMTDPALQMLAYELAAIFAILAIYLGYKQFKKAKEVNTQASTSVKKIKQLKKRRHDNLSSILSDKYGLEGDALTQTVEGIQSQEQLIHKSQVTLFVEQDDKTLKAAPQQIEKLVDKCLALLPVGQDRVQANIDKAEPESDALLFQTKEKVDLLLEEIRQLKSKLGLQQDDESSLEQAEVDLAEQAEQAEEITEEEHEADGFEQADHDAEEIEIVAGTEKESVIDSAEAEQQQEKVSDEMVSADDIDALLAEMESEQLVHDGIDLAENDEEVEQVTEEVVSVFAGYQDEDDDIGTTSSLEEANIETEIADIEEQTDIVSEDSTSQDTQQELANSENMAQVSEEEIQLAEMMADLAQNLESTAEVLNQQDDALHESVDQEIEEASHSDNTTMADEEILDEEQVAALREQVRQKTQKIQQES